VVAFLVAVFFVVPITAAQVGDVFRAWGDKPLSRAATGVSGALLLGAVCRTSAVRLMLPTPSSDWGLGISPRVALAAAIAVAIGFAVLRLWLGVGVLAAMVVVALVTDSVEPTQPAASRKPGLRRLAGTLAVVPLAIVFAGLAGAFVDSILLPSSLTDADGRLLVTALLVAACLGVLASFAHPPDNWTAPSWPSWPNGQRPLPPAVFIGAIGVLTALLAFAAGSTGVLRDEASIALVAVAAVLASWLLPEAGAPQFAGAGGASLGLLAAVYADPIAAPRALGTIGVALLTGAGLLVLLHLAATVSARREPKWVPLQAVPLLTLLTLWAVAAWTLAGHTGDKAHQARTVDARSTSLPLKDAVERWLNDQAGGSGEQVPMLLVAASGGGSKAAYWTDLVLDCLFGSGAPAGRGGECGPPEADAESPAAHADSFGRLFLTSSVSGGSIGIYHLVRNRRPELRWVDDPAGREVLSPTVAWGLLHDLPLFMVGAETDPRRCEDGGSCRIHADRALVQEAAVAGFEDGIVPPKGGGLLESGQRPVTVFNGALDGADGRVLLSPVELAPPRPRNPACRTLPTGEPAAGSVDGHDVLNANEDVPLVTAALLSARFPVVAPAARLGDTEQAKGTRGCKLPPTLPPVHVRDGGYVENSGLLTIVELLPSIAAAVEGWKADNHREELDVPLVVISVDDDPAVIEGDPEAVPARRDTLGISKRAGPGYLTRLARDRLESCQYPNVHYVRISPTPHIGAQAATGWELSSTTRDEDLAAALAQDQRAGKTVENLRDALQTHLAVRCPPE
jgi:MFS family permease